MDRWCCSSAARSWSGRRVAKCGRGSERLFVLWSEARTPAGVIVELASPGTDALGRSGVTGVVDTHFAARFGAAILISLIDAGTAALVASQSNGGSSVVIAPQGASDVVAEVLAPDRQRATDDSRARRAGGCRCWWRVTSALPRCTPLLVGDNGGLRRGREGLDPATREIVREVVLTHVAADPSAIPTALAQYVAALAPWLSDASVTELCINRPGEVFVERASGWTREAALVCDVAVVPGVREVGRRCHEAARECGDAAAVGVAADR